ncbi:mitochondrial carrier domain-containing protein [Syncephalis fuscata]|nr:mitochondrial carrier domain-containing protein [Syncephalis fuscata]
MASTPLILPSQSVPSAVKTKDAIVSFKPQLEQVMSSGLPNGLTRPQLYRNNFASGGIALALAYAIMHPLDTFKTRIQAAVVTSATPQPIKGLFTKEMFSVLSKGFVASVSGAAPQGALRLATYELAKGYLMHLPPTSPHSKPVPDWMPQLSQVPASAMAATIGDLASSVAKVPREVVTTRLQAGTASSSREVVEQVLKAEGVGGLFRGFWSTTLRDVPFMVILFTTYENFKLAHQRGWRPLGGQQHKDGDASGVPTMASTLFGGVSGAMAGFLTTPFDVIKTRVMVMTRSSLATNGAEPSAKQSLTVLGAARNIIAEARAQPRPGAFTLSQAFFAGAIPRSVWWFCICSIFFPVYERSKEVLNDKSQCY